MKQISFVRFILLAVFAGCISPAPARQSFLSGVIRQRETGQPISNLKVYTSFAEARTNSYGQYKLELVDCPRCIPGAEILIYTDNDSLGASETRCIISTDYNFSFSISSNPTRAYITGKVISSDNDEPIEGIRITASSEIDGVQTNEVRTDAYGLFKIAINKTQLKENKYMRLLARDPAGRYRMLGNYGEPAAYNINSFVVLRMQRRADTNRLSIAKYYRLDKNIRPNTHITINAGSSMKLGRFVGVSLPDGKDGVMGFPLTKYNIVPEFRHGALLYRFAGDETWKFAGAEKKITRHKGGYLEFEINDNKQSDNSGAYTVEVIIE